MKRRIALLCVFLVGPLAFGQQKKEENRPTLGPPTESSSEGPSTAVTTNALKLVQVQKIYVEPMDNGLGEKLLEGLGKVGRFQVVADRSLADSVLRGTCFDSRRLKTLHSEVFLSDRISGASIWQDNVHEPYSPPPLKKAVDETADLILKHLATSVSAALRH